MTIIIRVLCVHERDKIHVVSIPKYHKCLTSFSIYFYHDFIVFIIIVVLCSDIVAYTNDNRDVTQEANRTEETQEIFYLPLLDTVKIKPITDCLVLFSENTHNTGREDTTNAHGTLSLIATAGTGT